jgi:hypothetical protein
MSERTSPRPSWTARWDDGVARRWPAVEEAMDRALGPSGEAALARATPRRGKRVIDVGCGCGATSVALVPMRPRRRLTVQDPAPSPMPREPATSSRRRASRRCRSVPGASQGVPESIQRTSRSRSASVGLGPPPTGNCLAGGKALQPRLLHSAWPFETPQAISAFSFTTLATRW